MFVNLQLVVFMQYARFLLSHKADAISGRSRPWAKLGGGEGGRAVFCRLPCRLFFLLRFFLFFFFFTQNKGVGGGGNWPPGPYLRSITAHITNTIYVREWMLDLNHALRLWTFPPVPKNIPFGSSLAYHNQKKKSVQSSSSSFEDTGGVLFDR